MDSFSRVVKQKVAPRALEKMPRKNKVSSLAMDLSVHIRLMRLAGHFLPDFDPVSSDSCSKFSISRAIYSVIHMTLMSLQFTAMAVEMAQHFDDMSALTTNAISLLFFLHGPTKVFYFAFCRRRFYKTILSWDSSLTDKIEESAGLDNEAFGRKMPVTSNNANGDGALSFEASNARYRHQAARKIRKLLVSVLSGSAAAVAFWSLRPFLGLGHYGRTSSVNATAGNTSTLAVEGRRQWNLLVDATYPWDTSSDLAYAFTFLYQLYWIVFCLAQINLLDLLLCSWLIFACEQIRHLKDILQPLMELSEFNKPITVSSAGDNPPPANIAVDLDSVSFQPQPTFSRNRASARRTILSVIQEPSLFSRNDDSTMAVGANFGTHRRLISNNFANSLSYTSNGALQPLGMRVFQNNEVDTVVHNSIRYWVEKHKHVVRFVDCIEDSYGMALLIHMLTSTITLTLLSYEATKISSVDMHAITVITYLFYTLGQVFLFCVYGNKLIEESTSVMQAAYESPWYDCTEEAKAFIQIVCQKSQRAMSISGAKFFTVSLDLFASVLGAVVTYFMVLIQLK